MKSFKIIGVLFLLTTFLSCTQDPDFTGSKQQTAESSSETARSIDQSKMIKIDLNVYAYFHSDKDTPIDKDRPQMFYDAEGKRPMVFPYWHCGGGVYTNGNQSQNYTITWGSGTNIYLDDFCQCAYTYSVSWGGSC